MKPILFSENSTGFKTNGIGRLYDAISCIVTEQRNGEYELEMEYPITGQHYPDLGARKIICVIPSYGTALQAFRIYKISKPISGRVIVSAQHISYDLSKNVAMPFSVAASSSACASTLAGLKTNAVEACPFTFWTDVTTAAGYTQMAPASIRQMLGGVEGSVLDQFGGEYEFDNFSVKLHRKRGSDKGVTLRYGKNITDLTQEENIANTITGVVPYWTNMDGTESVVLPEKAVYSPNASKYSHKLTIPLDLSDKWDEAPAVATLRTAAQAYVNGSDIGIPKVSVKVSFVNLRDTEEYREIASMESVNLCDDIHVQFEPLGIDTTAEIVETVWDVLMERYDSVTVGALKTSLAATINDQNMHTMAEIDKSRVSANNAINNATKWLTSAGGYVIAIKNDDGSWKELVFASSIDLEAKTTKCLRINNNGLGFSTTGINGPYTNAWTIDGNLVADFIHGGTLTLGGNGNGNGWLKMVNAAGQQIGKWDKDGISIGAGSITGGTINGATVTVGGGGNGSGTLQVKDASGNVVVTLNNGGITINKGSMKGTVITLGGKANPYGTLQVQDANGKNVVTLDSNGVTMLGGSISISDNKGSTIFGVTSAGEVTAKSGTIGGFTIDSDTIRKGNKNATGSGAVCLSNADFTRTVAGASRTNLRLAISNKFGVAADGSLFCTNATIKGDLKFNNSVEIDGKKYDDTEEAISALDGRFSRFAEAQEKVNSGIYEWFKEIWADGVGEYHDPIGV